MKSVGNKTDTIYRCDEYELKIYSWTANQHSIKSSNELSKCSIYAIKLHRLDKVLLYIVTDRNIAFLVPLSHVTC
jgi:hypothetical protein